MQSELRGRDRSNNKTAGKFWGLCVLLSPKGRGAKGLWQSKLVSKQQSERRMAFLSDSQMKHKEGFRKSRWTEADVVMANTFGGILCDLPVDLVWNALWEIRLLDGACLYMAGLSGGGGAWESGGRWEVCAGVSRGFGEVCDVKRWKWDSSWGRPEPMNQAEAPWSSGHHRSQMGPWLNAGGDEGTHTGKMGTNRLLCVLQTQAYKCTKKQTHIFTRTQRARARRDEMHVKHMQRPCNKTHTHTHSPKHTFS